MELTKLDPAEKSRIYTFPGGELVKLENVTHFLARDSGTHRLQTGDGKLHIVPVGWVAYRDRGGRVFALNTVRMERPEAGVTGRRDGLNASPGDAKP